MKEALRITLQEIENHNGMRGDSGKTQEWEDGFISGLKHMAGLFDVCESAYHSAFCHTEVGHCGDGEHGEGYYRDADGSVSYQ